LGVTGRDGASIPNTPDELHEVLVSTVNTSKPSSAFRWALWALTAAVFVAIFFVIALTNVQPPLSNLFASIAIFVLGAVVDQRAKRSGESVRFKKFARIAAVVLVIVGALSVASFGMCQ
jgi:hypothetical protein